MLSRKTILLSSVLFFLNLTRPVFCQTSITATNPFTFNLSNSARTSAGVFKPDGTLVRTLWSAVNFSAGEHTENWDGLLDDGSAAPTDSYQIKILSGNVNYEWEGAVVGNTSTALTGNTKLRFFDPLYGMAVTNNTIYWAAGYNEGWPSNYKTSIDNPNSKTWIGPHKQTNQMTSFVCTDGAYVYWAGYDPFDNNYESFVFATKVNDDTRAVFGNGVTASMEWGSTYQSVISYKSTSKSNASLITGIAVQNTGNYFFVSRKGLNELQVLNKTTGALVQTITMASPSVMQVDSENNLWLAHGGVVEKYIVNNDGSITSANITIPLSNVGAISVSPDNANVIVADINSEQVKAYSNSTGSSLWSLGTSESYINNATVEDNKFYWKDVRKEYPAFLCYMPDGTFYVGDPQNKRVQHYAANQTFIDRIMYLSSYYNAFADPNNPTRVFADFLEFKIDYSKPLAPDNNSWALVKNWGANISDAYDPFEKMKYVVTFNNGRTYARIRQRNDYSIIELVEGGSVRFTSVQIPSFGILSKEGSLITSTTAVLGQSQILRKYPLNGFDNLSNPVWSTTPETIAATPAITANDPIPWEGFRAEPVTSSDKIIFFDYSKAEFGHGEGYHLGAINKNSNKWLWRTAQGTSTKYTGPFPEDGAFDNGNGVIYAGGLALMSDQNIFWNYHGEFWKQSQTNKWNHVYDNGLLVGQFGELTSDYPGIEAFSGGAGNVLTGTVVKVNGDTYLYHNDEGVHGGVHRWKITGVNTIQVQTAIYPTTKRFTPKEGIDLLEGLVRDISLQNGSFGWNRTPTTDNTTNGTYFKATTGNKTYNKLVSPDLFLKYRISLGSAYVIRELGDNSGLLSWKVWGKVNFDENTPNEARNRGGSYMEVLDRNNLIIARFYIGRDMVSGINIIGNSQVMYNGSETDVHVKSSKNQPIEISADNGLIKFSYANHTLSTSLLIDNAADWRSPTTLRFHFFTNFVADDFERSIDIAEMRFSNNPLLILPVTISSIKAYQKAPGILVDWTTEYESNIDRYEVEKSFDGQQFIKIGAVPAKEAGSLTKNYSWLDTNPKEGNNYYRIKAIDHSGIIKYSQIVNVKFNTGKGNFEVYPNPVTADYSIVQFNNISKGIYMVKLISSSGQVILKKTIHHSGGSASQTIPIDAHLHAGAYYLQITGNGISFNKQILKQSSR